MEHDESDTPLKPAEVSSQAFHQPLDISRSECPQEALIWQGLDPSFGFTRLGGPLVSTTPDFHTTPLLPTRLYHLNEGNLAPSSTENSQQYSQQFLGESSSAEYAYPGSSIEALGSLSTQFTAPRGVSNLNDWQNPIPPLPSHGMATARSGRQRSAAWSFRRPEGRTIRDAPVAAGHPYQRPLHTEIQEVPNPCLIPSVQPVAVQPSLTMDEDIERHIGHNDAGRWFCTRCNGKSDKRRNRIRDHVAACLGYDMYPCNGGCGDATCQIKCKTRQNLREHQQRQHRQCPECGETVRRQNLTRHIINKHRQGT